MIEFLKTYNMMVNYRKIFIYFNEKEFITFGNTRIDSNNKNF